MKDSNFQLGAPFKRSWYSAIDKTSKYKLGKLYYGTINGSD